VRTDLAAIKADKEEERLSALQLERDALYAETKDMALKIASLEDMIKVLQGESFNAIVRQRKPSCLEPETEEYLRNVHTLSVDEIMSRIVKPAAEPPQQSDDIPSTSGPFQRTVRLSPSVIDLTQSTASEPPASTTDTFTTEVESSAVLADDTNPTPIPNLTKKLKALRYTLRPRIQRKTKLNPATHLRKADAAVLREASAVEVTTSSHQPAAGPPGRLVDALTRPT
jgi:hypothetical protein